MEKIEISMNIYREDGVKVIYNLNVNNIILSLNCSSKNSLKIKKFPDFFISVESPKNHGPMTVKIMEDEEKIVSFN